MLLTFREAARRLAISQSTLRRIVAKGDLPVVDMGAGEERAQFRIRISDLEAFVESRTFTAPPKDSPVPMTS
jgi:excisionase family DNA binding protein